jgi:hypothetical protein
MALNLDKLSLWELAHRWHGYDPHKSDDAREIPLEVKDTLRNLAKEIADESLYSTLLLSREMESQHPMERGMGLLLRSPWWRKPRRTAVEDYAQEWEQCIRHNIIDRAFLEAVEIPYWELEYWCRENHVPMPGFWVRSRSIGGKQFPLPGAQPFDAEKEAGEAPGGDLEGIPANDSLSSQQKAALARHEPVNQLKRVAPRGPSCPLNHALCARGAPDNAGGLRSPDRPSTRHS